jgi:hypothetical protein
MHFSLSFSAQCDYGKSQWRALPTGSSSTFSMTIHCFEQVRQVKAGLSSSPAAEYGPLCCKIRWAYCLQITTVAGNVRCLCAEDEIDVVVLRPNLVISTEEELPALNPVCACPLVHAWLPNEAVCLSLSLLKGSVCTWPKLLEAKTLKNRCLVSESEVARHLFALLVTSLVVSYYMIHQIKGNPASCCIASH